MPKIKQVFCLLILMGCLGLIHNALAQQLIDIDVLKDFVDSGAQYIQQVGAEAAYREINNPHGKFVKKHEKYVQYLFVYDFKGNCLARGDNAANYVGKNLIGMKNQFGVLIIQNLIEVAKSGSGFFGYYYSNVATGADEFKLSYVKKIDNTTFIGSGIYIK